MDNDDAKAAVEATREISDPAPLPAASPPRIASIFLKPQPKSAIKQPVLANPTVLSALAAPNTKAAVGVDKGGPEEEEDDIEGEEEEEEKEEGAAPSKRKNGANTKAKATSNPSKVTS